MRLKIAILSSVLLSFLFTVNDAQADTSPNGGSVSTDKYGAYAKAWHKLESRRRASPQKPAAARPKPKYTYVPKEEYETRQKAYQSELQRAIQNNAAIANAQARCTESPTGLACNGGAYVNLPGDFNIRPAGDPAAPAAAPVPVVSPQQAAYIASARLRLTAPKPMIGPPPSINKWKMAAVGYPMWLWADGNLHPAPVSDSVYDLAVSLDARLVKVVYEMGDGHKVTCTDVSRSWNSGIPAAAESPVCGYTYEQPSLPSVEYTITANAVWAVDWTVNNTTGTIPFFQSASTQLPVGELQVLNR